MPGRMPASWSAARHRGPQLLAQRVRAVQQRRPPPPLQREAERVGGRRLHAADDLDVSVLRGPGAELDLQRFVFARQHVVHRPLVFAGDVGGDADRRASDGHTVEPVAHGDGFRQGAGPG